MAKRGNPFGGMGGMGNMNQMMKQAKKMQEQLAKAQEEIQQAEVEYSSGGGMVTVKCNGEHKLLSISIKPEAIDPEDPEMLEDLVLTAVNGAMEQIEELSANKMGAFGGIPGLF
ncbi:MAG: YbaB/EbfC family nucleoid-associated protein [Eubacteriales bacterium]|nr:YbaB/EbfC family nucleoid-associated protein [Eubacteriales bacterium]